MPLDALSEVSDEALLVAYGNGDPAAARALTLRFLPRLVPFAARMLGGDVAEAEDVAQEAMLRLWRMAPDWRPGEAKVTTWLFKVAANLCIDRQRRRRRGVALDAVAEPRDDAPPVVSRLQDDTRIRALDAAIAGLPDRQRQAVVLRHLDGLANPEIAEIMDISVEAVESLTARGKRALAQALAGRRGDLGYDDEG